MEILDGVCATLCQETSCLGTLHGFELSIIGSETSRCSTISYNTFTRDLHCTCQKFEAIGILCSYILKVLHFKNVTKIPNKYILNRWKK